MPNQYPDKLINVFQFLHWTGQDILYLDEKQRESIANIANANSNDEINSRRHKNQSQIEEKAEDNRKPSQIDNQSYPAPSGMDKKDTAQKRLSKSEMQNEFLAAVKKKERDIELAKELKESISEVETNKDKSDNVDKDWINKTTLPQLDEAINSCVACKLGYTRNEFVFGEGNPNASIMIVGEAPGADEDKHGRPFIGRAGKLLTKIINAIGFDREEVFIANVIKCRPPANRRPEKEEVAECKPYLIKQIELVKPDFIVALGLTAAESLTGNKFKMKDVRGSFLSFESVPLMITYHPAALLRNPNWKKNVWEDMQLLLARYNEIHPEDKRQASTKKETQ
jgi:DNA polymerase